MKRMMQTRRAVATLMLGVVATMLVAPVAEAGHGRGHRRYKRVAVVREVRYAAPSCPTPVYYQRRHSDAGPILAGIVGGLVLGAALSNAQPAVHASYSYWDPYCEDSYTSLTSYRTHSRHCSHPQVVRVVEVRSGDPVRDLCWQNDAWREYDGDWDRRGDYGSRYKDDRDWDDD